MHFGVGVNYRQKSFKLKQSIGCKKKLKSKSLFLKKADQKNIFFLNAPNSINKKSITNASFVCNC